MNDIQHGCILMKRDIWHQFSAK